MDELVKSVYTSLRANAKYESISDDDLNDLIVDCGYLYCRLRCLIADKVKKFNGTEINWIKRASKEVLDKTLLDLPSGVLSYSESVYKIVFDDTYISKSLIGEVIPLVYALTETYEEPEENENTDGDSENGESGESNDTTNGTEPDGDGLNSSTPNEGD